MTVRTGIDRMTDRGRGASLDPAGLLQRRRCRRDTCAYVVKVTEDGRTLLAAAERVARRADARLLRTLPPERRGSLLRSLKVTVGVLEGRQRRKTEAFSHPSFDGTLPGLSTVTPWSLPMNGTCEWPHTTSGVPSAPAMWATGALPYVMSVTAVDMLAPRD